MAADRLKQEREAFEAFMRSEGWEENFLLRDKTDSLYMDSTVRAMWLGWAARAAHGVSRLDHQTFSQQTPMGGGETK